MWSWDADVWFNAETWLGMCQEREGGIQVAAEGGGICGRGPGESEDEW